MCIKKETRDLCYEGYVIIRKYKPTKDFKELADIQALKLNLLIGILSEIEKINK